MAKPRVAFVTPVDPRHSFRGTEKIIYKYADYLARNSLETEVLVPSYHFSSKQKALNRVSLPKTIEEHRIHGVKVRLPFRYDLYFYYPLPKGAVVYLPYSPYTNMPNLISKPRGQKLIVGLHGLHLRNGRLTDGHDAMEGMLVSMLKLLVLSREDITRNVYYHAINSAQKEYLSSLGIDRSHIFHIPVSIETEELKAAQGGSGPLRVLHIGGKDKDASRVAEIIVELKRRHMLDGFEFFFIGKDQPDSLVELARRNKSVHLLGSITDAGKNLQLSKADVMLVPALEAFSVTLLEGLASGELVIARRSNPQTAELRSTGISLLQADDLSSYLSALLGASRMKRAGRLSTLGRRNAAVVRRRFSAAALMPKILKMFESVARDATHG